MGVFRNVILETVDRWGCVSPPQQSRPGGRIRADILKGKIKPRASGQEAELCLAAHGVEERKEEAGVSVLTYTGVAPDEPLPSQALVDVLEGDALTNTVGMKVCT